MWALVHSECLLEERLLRLSHQLSDANLAQMPEFHQRVQVLRRLEYVAPDNTVQMKVAPSSYYSPPPTHPALLSPCLLGKHLSGSMEKNERLLQALITASDNNVSSHVDRCTSSDATSSTRSIPHLEQHPGN